MSSSPAPSFATTWSVPGTFSGDASQVANGIASQFGGLVNKAQSMYASPASAHYIVTHGQHFSVIRTAGIVFLVALFLGVLFGLRNRHTGEHRV
jgi:hypothetical protein